MSDAGFYVLCLVLTAVIHGGLTLGMKWWVYKRVWQMHQDNTTLMTQLSQDLDEFDSRLCALVGWAQLSRAAAKDTEATVTKVAKVAEEVKPSHQEMAAKLEDVAARVKRMTPSPEGSYPRPPSGRDKT